MKYCGKFAPDLMVNRDDTSINILKIEGMPPNIEYSLYIYANFRVDAYKYREKIPVRDLINGFSNIVDKCFQVDVIVTRLRDTPKDTQTELRYIGNNILSLSKNNENFLSLESKLSHLPLSNMESDIC